MNGARLQSADTHTSTLVGGRFAGDRFIVLLAGAFMLAIAARLNLPSFWCALPLALMLPFFVLRRTRMRALAICVCFLLGIAACNRALSPLAMARTQRERNVTVSGVVTQLETMENARVRATIEDVALDGISVSGAYSMWFDAQDALPARYDTIGCTCRLRVKNAYGNAGGEYILTENTRNNAWIYFADPDQMQTSQTDFDACQRLRFGFKDVIESVRARIHKAVFANVSDDSCAAICYGMLVGDSSYLDEETYAVFRDGGVLHLLAVSGLHIGATAAALAFLIGRIPLPRVFRVLLSLLVVSFYVLVCGASVSAQRAAVLFGVVSIAPMLLRRADGLCSLAAAAIFVLALDPLALFSAGFRLSFGAAAAIVMLARGWTQRLSAWLLRMHIPFANPIAATLCVSFAAQLGVLPCMLSVFGSVPASSFFINPIVVPFAGVLLACSWLTVLFDLLGFLAPVCGRICEILFSGVVSVTRFASSVLPDLTLPFWLPFVFRALFFALLFFLCDLCLLQKKRKRALCVLLCAALVICYASAFAVSRTRERLTVFDVGQGQCALIQTGGENILVDCGSSVYGGISAQALCSALRRSGAGHIDVMILSHADADHTSLAGRVIDSLRVDTLVCAKEALPQGIADDPSVVWMDAQSAKETTFAHDHVRILRGSGQKSNDESFIVHARIGEQNVLLMGDAGAREEVLLYDKTLASCDVLVVGHHGADSGTSKKFVSMLGADTAVISAGRDNLYAHPDKIVLSRLRRAGMDVYCTKECGMICIDGRGTVSVYYENGYPF